MARKKQPKGTGSEKLDEQAVAVLAEFAAMSIVAGDRLGIARNPVEYFPLTDPERTLAAECPGLAATLKRKLSKPSSQMTMADTASLLSALAKSLPACEPQQQAELLPLTVKLMLCLRDKIELAASARAEKPKPTDSVYQFKITLLGARPPIWRRIQIKDCTLDQLHEHIQTAMGWTNSHLHQFDIKGTRYGDPQLLGGGVDEFEGVDSTGTVLSQILSRTRKRFAFTYEYDFGDGWEHEVLFEGSPPADPKAKYPRCLEGERACPPEDCGGIWGYADFLEAIANPKHEEHENMLEWIGGRFDPEKFDAKKATRAMIKGLPNWRDMR